MDAYANERRRITRSPGRDDAAGLESTPAGAKRPDAAYAARSTTRITRLMALAIKFQDMVDRGEVRDYADIARLGYVTRARITQIMNLLHLAPAVQEEILFLKCAPPERSMRPLTVQPLWDRQLRIWRRLKAENQINASFASDPDSSAAPDQTVAGGKFQRRANAQLRATPVTGTGGLPLRGAL